MARRSRTFSDLSKQELLTAARVARRGCVKALADAPINSDDYRAILKLKDAIDDLAQALTGDREHLWERTANSALTGPPPGGRKPDPGGG